MRVADHRFQIDRIREDARGHARQARLVRRLQGVGNAVLLAAGILILFSITELFENPAPLAAAALIGELLAVQLDLIAHLFMHFLKHHIDENFARLRFELDMKGDDLRRAAAEMGVHWEDYLPQ